MLSSGPPSPAHGAGGGGSGVSPGTIRARLALSIALVLVVTLGVLGVLLAEVARFTLTSQLDDQVLGAAAQAGPPPDPTRAGPTATASRR